MSSGNWDKENLAKKAKDAAAAAANNLKDAKASASQNLNSAKHTIENNFNSAQKNLPPKIAKSSNKVFGFLALGVGALFLWKFYEQREFNRARDNKLIKQKH